MSVTPLRSTAGPRRALVVTVIGLLLVAVALFFFWPLGVALGVALGLLVVLGLGRQQDRADRAVVVEDLSVLAPALASAVPAPTGPPAVATAVPVPVAPTAVVPVTPVEVEPSSRDEQGVRADLVRLKAELGDDYPDFARAARLVVSTQYASAARLQRDLQLPYSRARRLLADLESEHFVGPATGTLPRQVLLTKDRLPEVEELFAGV